MIASPEMFLAAAGERSRRIHLGTGVISLPYHHPFNVAQRMVQLDYMTGGRAIFGSGPGALASDAHTLGSTRWFSATARTKPSASSAACSRASA
jgi:limonene 1,2-monooxygenase